MHFNTQPNELLLKELLKLSIADIARFCRVNRRLSELCKSNFLWRNLLKRDYPTLNLDEIKNYKLRYRQENLIQYLLESAGYNLTNAFIKTQRDLVMNMPAHLLQIMENIRNDVVPIANMIAPIPVSYDDEVVDIKGFILDPKGNIVFTTYGFAETEFLELFEPDPNLRKRQTELFKYVKQFHGIAQGLPDEETFINTQRQVVYRLNEHELDFLDFIIEEVVPYIGPIYGEDGYINQITGFSFILYEDYGAQIVFI